MAGGPSQIDLFDPKPEMKKWEGQPLPESMRKGLKFAFIKPTSKIWASPRVFTHHGQSGIEFCDWLPRLATCADDICMIRSMYSEVFNHHPAQLMLSCGSPLVGLPSMGAWVSYGLGSESQSLPGFVVLRTGRRQQRRNRELGQRLPAFHLSRRALSELRRPGAAPVQSPRS